MKKIHELLSRPAVTVVLFILAAALLAGSSVTGALAALNNKSTEYYSDVKIPTVGVKLVENGKTVSDGGAILTDLLGSDSVLIPGKKYSEELKIQNSSTDTPAFVRVTIYKYWKDASGKVYMNGTKDLDTSKIVLDLASGGKWLLEYDPTNTNHGESQERAVLYYSEILAPGATTTAFLNGITIDDSIINQAHWKKQSVTGGTILTVYYDYDGYSFCLDVKVDAVQTHNAEQAVASAWGNNVKVVGDTLQIVKEGGA